MGDEGNLVCNSGFAILELALSDRADGLNPGESRFGSGHGLEPAHRAQSLLRCGMVALDPIVQVLAIDMPDRILSPSQALISPITFA